MQTEWYERWKVQHRVAGCLINVTRLLFTLMLLIVAIGYSFSLIKVDINVILIVVIVILIWFMPTIARYFENIQVSREGDKLSLNVTLARQLQKIEEKAEEANLLQTPNTSQEIERFVAIARIHPNSALVALRTDLEIKLRQILEASEIEVKLPASRVISMHGLLSQLAENDILTRDEVMVLSELRTTLNEVAHTADVPSSVIQWAVDTGPFVLAALDKKLINIQQQNL